MDKIIPKTTFYQFKKEFWDSKNWETIQNWANSWFERFSNEKVRVSYAKAYNPERFTHLTLLMDGKDIVVNFTNISKEFRETRNGKSNLISRKNGWRNGGKQQVLSDCRCLPLLLSDTLGCNEIYDGHQAANMFETYEVPLAKCFTKYDVITTDGHFVSELNKFQKLKEETNGEFSEKNFVLQLSNKKT